MNRHQITDYLIQLDTVLHSAKLQTPIRIEILGSSALAFYLDEDLEVGDVDARWDPYDDMHLYPAIEEVSNINHIPKKWLNNAIMFICDEPGKWQEPTTLDNIALYLPTPDYLMFKIAGALKNRCTGEEAAAKKAIDQCKRFTQHMQWDLPMVIEKIKPFYPMEKIPLPTLDMLELCLLPKPRYTPSKEYELGR